MLIIALIERNVVLFSWTVPAALTLASALPINLTYKETLQSEIRNRGLHGG
jgi:hypothetical protein